MGSTRASPDLASELSQREVEKPTSYSALLAGNESDVPVSSPA
jgi:hypothetical protein